MWLTNTEELQYEENLLVDILLSDTDVVRVDKLHHSIEQGLCLLRMSVHVL